MIDEVPTFAELHVPGKPFMLVNAWDVMSALAFADAGHPAIGTTSLGITAAAGLLDGAREGRNLTVCLARALGGRFSAHLSVDLEDGYTDDPAAVADLVAQLAQYGVAGVNIEDANRSTAIHAAIIADVKSSNPQVFVNARTDVFWSGSGDPDEALARLRAYRDAGADGLFVPGLNDRAVVAEVVAIGPPVNVLFQLGDNFASEGIARISTGSALYRHSLVTAIETAAAAREGTAPSGQAVTYAWTQRLLAASGSADNDSMDTMSDYRQP